VAIDIKTIIKQKVETEEKLKLVLKRLKKMQTTIRQWVDDSEEIPMWVLDELEELEEELGGWDA